MLPRALACVCLLFLSNIFMNLAWYGHLRWFKDYKAGVATVLLAIGVSWLLALPEYCLQVPGNRLGHRAYGGPFDAPQLKIIQEAVTLIVFTGVSVWVLREKPRPTDLVAMGLVLLAVGISAWGAARSPRQPTGDVSSEGQRESVRSAKMHGAETGTNP